MALGDTNGVMLLVFAAGAVVAARHNWEASSRHTWCARPPPLPRLNFAASDKDTSKDKQTSLVEWHGRIFSQIASDGILWKIFEDLGTTNRFFVEFGTVRRTV